MKNSILLSALILAISSNQIALAESRYSLENCRLSEESSQNLEVVNNRLIYSTEGNVKRIRLSERAARIECSDTDGDSIDEIVSYSRSGAATVHTVAAKTRSSLSNVCKRVRSLNRGEIYKSRASDHINDQRKFSTSFITLRSTTAPKNNCLYVYDKKGNLIHKLGRYFPTGTAYSSRYYGGHGCGDLKSASSVAGTARKNTGSSAGYMTSGTGNCVLIPNLSSCFNSSAC